MMNHILESGTAGNPEKIFKEYKKMKIIAVINQKGGAGKTTFSILLSLALAIVKDKKVLCVDLDPQAGLTVKLLKKHVNAGILDMLMGKPEFIIHHIERGGAKIDLIPSYHKLDEIYATINIYALESLFHGVQNYDYIVFDCPPTMKGVTQSAGFIADEILIPADIDEGTLDSTVYTLNTLKTQLKKSGQVVTVGYKEPKKDSNTFKSNLMRDYKKKLGKSIIGNIPIGETIKKATAEINYKWTAKRKEILQDIINIAGLAK